MCSMNSLSYSRRHFITCSLLSSRTIIITAAIKSHHHFCWIRLASSQSTTTTPTTTPPPVSPPTTTWVDTLPRSITWTKPYLQLARVDKPIGTWLLYWPCGKIIIPSCPYYIYTHIYSLTYLHYIDSMVYHDGSLLGSSPHRHLVNQFTPLWDGSSSHARRRLYNQRSMGS